MTAPSPACTGAILAGGQAVRYGGQPKGLERVGGRRIVDRVAAALAQVADRVVLVANASGAEHWLPGVPCIRDVHVGVGPLGGLHAAFAHSSSALLVVAWDMPFVPASLLGELRHTGERTDADAVVPVRDAAGRVEPLCAYYAPSAAQAVLDHLARGEHRMTALLAAMHVHRLPLARVVDWGDPERLFLNVNTRTELRAANCEL